jgi:5,10-methylenetetrahydromethanopterin reductase
VSPAVVLTAATIRPGHRSGRSYRHVVISGGKVRALAHTEAEAAQAAGRLVPDAVLDRFAFSGTPDQVAAQVKALFEAGATRVEFGTPHGLTAAHGIELLGRRVLPAVRLAAC